jgi:PKHD-type hydroxylase
MHAQDGQMLGELVFQALGRSRDFHRCALPLEISLPLLNRYRAGMSYGPHFDRAYMMGANNRQIRADLSATLFVSPPRTTTGASFASGRTATTGA